MSQSSCQIDLRPLLNVEVRNGLAVVPNTLSIEDYIEWFEKVWVLIKIVSFICTILGLENLHGVWRLEVKSSLSAANMLDLDLHTTSVQEIESWFHLDVVVREGYAVFQLLSSEHKSLLIGRDTLLVLNLGLHVFNSIAWLNIEGNSLSCKGLDEDLHLKILHVILINYKL